MAEARRRLGFGPNLYESAIYNTRVATDEAGDMAVNNNEVVSTADVYIFGSANPSNNDLVARLYGGNQNGTLLEVTQLGDNDFRVMIPEDKISFGTDYYIEITGPTGFPGRLPKQAVVKIHTNPPE